MLFVSGVNAPPVLEAAEHALDEIAVPIEGALNAGMLTRFGKGLMLAHAPRAAKASRGASLS